MTAVLAPSGSAAASSQASDALAVVAQLPPPLDTLEPAEQAALAPYIELAQFAAGEVIFKAGTPGDSCYVIDSGVVRIELGRREHGTGSEVDSDDVLGYVEPGLILGELALLDGLPRSATAVAQTAVSARCIHLDAIARLRAEHPLAVAALYTALGRAAALKLRATNERLAQAVFAEAPDPEVEAMVDAAVAAQAQFESWDERRVDRLLRDMAHAIAARARELAQDTVDETHLGDIDSKAIKNRVASLVVYRSMARQRGTGAASRGAARGVTEISAPVGVVFGVIPVTNPVATFIFKALITLKSRNALIVSPSRESAKVCAKVDDILRDVLRAHGAPDLLIQCVRNRANRKKTGQLMTHRKVSLILATGGASVVKAAYSSGKPAIGVGPGNTPTLLCADADIRRAARGIVLSKCFDNGLLCGAEHNLVVVRARRDELMRELERSGAAVLTPDETVRFTAAVVNPQTHQFRLDIVGQPGSRIAARAGIERPYEIKLLIVPTEGVSATNPYAREKMAPFLSLFTADDDATGIQVCRDLLAIDGLGHTAVIHTRSRALSSRFGMLIPASRILVNSPASLGIVGLTSSLTPSLTLGCGTYGGTSTTDNVTFSHLVNVKRLARYAPQPFAMVDAGAPFEANGSFLGRAFRLAVSEGRAWLAARRSP